MRKRGLLLITMGFVFLAVAGSARAMRFENPPETSAPVWYTQFPYQRNVYWDFATNPEGGPSDDGLPGADYEGRDDPTLWETDFVELDNVEWFENFEYGPVGGSTITLNGVIGVDNRQGTSSATGTALLHLDNWDRPWLKHVWLEWMGQTGGGTDLTFILSPADGSEVTAVDLQPPNIWWAIYPNPLWEEFRITFDVPSGSFLVLDSLHIATECVPEPGTLALLGCGLLGLGLCAWRRKLG